jgi:hypothetical protein
MKNSFGKLKNEGGVGYAIKIYAIAIVVVLVLLVGFFALEAWCAMWLWNAILPALFSFVGPITFWQMVGLQFLIALLVPTNWNHFANSLSKD